MYDNVQFLRRRHGQSMYIMYLSVNREGKLECKCDIFIVNAESFLYTTVVSGYPLLFRYCGFLFYNAEFVALRFLFSPDSPQSLN